VRAFVVSIHHGFCYSPTHPVFAVWSEPGCVSRLERYVEFNPMFYSSFKDVAWKANSWTSDGHVPHPELRSFVDYQVTRSQDVRIPAVLAWDVPEA
jgi:hypothetical protein